jgi:hypothetical protein
MQRLCLISIRIALLAVLMLITSSAVWGTSQPGSCEGVSVTSQVQGIKIVSYINDPKAHNGSVTFQNTTKKELHAVQGEVIVTHMNGRVGVDRNLWLSLGDPYRTARMKVHPDSPVAKMWANGHARGPLKPGENYTQEFSYAFTYGDGEEIACVKVMIEFAVYSDNTAESANDKLVQDYINSSLKASQQTDVMVQAATDILNANVQHPFTSFLKLADERHYVFNQIAYEMPRAGDDDATEATKLRGFIAMHKEISKVFTENSHIKVVGQ